MHDIHCHIEHLNFNEARIIIEKAINCGVKNIALVSEDMRGSEKNIRLKEYFPNNLLIGAGMHPAYLHQWSEERLSDELNFIKKNAKIFDFIGEVGLDFCKIEDKKIKALQEDILEELLTIASYWNKPLNIHSRWALRKTLERMIDFKKETGINVLMHWFTQSKKLVRLASKNKIYVSAGTLVLYREEVRDVSKEIDIHYLLTETDTPVPIDGNITEPSLIPKIIDILSKEYKIEINALEVELDKNFSNFFQNK